jgi:hypothetical protein
MNADYGATFTPDPSCAKGRVLRDQTINIRKVLKDAGMSAEVVTAATRKLFEAGLRQGLETPCIVCYEYEKQLTGFNAKPATYGSKMYQEGSIDKHIPTIRDYGGGILRGYGVGDFKAVDIPSLLALGMDLARWRVGYGGYTKNLWLPEILGDAGYKTNISTGKNLKVGHSLDVAIPYRDRYEHVGIEYTAINEGDLHFAGEHPKVDHLIPSHLGGGTPEWFLKNATGLEIKNFQQTQSEKVLGKVLHSAALNKKFNMEKLTEVRKMIRNSKMRADVAEYLAAVEKGSDILKIKIEPMFKQYVHAPWYHKLIGVGGAEFGKSVEVPMIDITKVNLDRAIEYLKTPEVSSADLKERYGEIANKIINASKRGGVKAVQKMDAKYLAMLIGVGAGASAFEKDE